MHAYALTQKETLSGRALEREIFSRITARLAAADRNTPRGKRDLTTALYENRRLWIALAVDLVSPGNTCSDELKGALLSLARFVERHTDAVMRDEAFVDPLVEINTNIISGLGGQTQDAA